MSTIDAGYREVDAGSDPNERFPAGPKVEWANAADLRPGDAVLQLKLIYEVLESTSSDREDGLWELSLGNPRDYREGFRIDKVLPRERKLVLVRDALYRRLVAGG